MVREQVLQDDLFYHAVHGLCRVRSISKPSRSGEQKTSYTLVPKTDNKMNISFVISETDLEASGFHPPMTPKEANKIIKFLKESPEPETAAVSFTPPTDAWGLAKVIQTSAPYGMAKSKDQRSREVLDRCVKGLVGELSIALKKSIEETVSEIRKSLGNPSKVNPCLLSALVRVCED